METILSILLGICLSLAAAAVWSYLTGWFLGLPTLVEMYKRKYHASNK